MRMFLLGLVFSSTLAMLGCEEKPSGKVSSTPKEDKSNLGQPPAPPPPPPPPK